MNDDTQAQGGDDPYWHLHDADFEAPFMSPRLTAERSVFMGGRDVVSLNGDWRFAIDPMREGLRQRWFEYDAQPIDDWIVPRDYDSGDWQTTPVPGCWTTQRAEWLRYEGAAWYARTFDAEPPADNRRTFLRIGAANERARVFLNGVFCGLHLGGSTPFFVDVTAHLQTGGNTVMIEVDSTRRADAVPMHHTDWFNHGGLYRDVELVTVSAVHIAHLFVRLTTGGVAVDVKVSGAADGVAEVRIAGLAETQIETRSGTGAAVLDCAPTLWSPDTPHLYNVDVTFGDDRVTDRIGFRTITRQGHTIQLNGQPLRLRGIGVHEDDRDMGKCSNADDIRRRFAHLRDLGANIARAAHYPHHDLVARIADEVGILLWEEIPVYWAIAFDNPSTFENARNQLVELIRRDANRASVILWGVGNENADTDARLAFMRGLADAARAEDPSRLITAACLINRETFRIEDRLAEHLDVIGLNQYFGWYEPGFEGLERLLENSDPDRPVVISETGADALAGMHGPESQLFTEEYQAKVLTRQVEIAARADYVAGVFVWLLYDFRTDRRQTRHQRGWNLKGVVAADKITQKLGFDALAGAFDRHFADPD
ncbi:MAG: glycoside hydrolase family 2 TIM barrel-domain containing protein [Pseudomonadota bacterium]